MIYIFQQMMLYTHHFIAIVLSQVRVLIIQTVMLLGQIIQLEIWIIISFNSSWIVIVHMLSWDSWQIKMDLMILLIFLLVIHLLHHKMSHVLLDNTTIPHNLYAYNVPRLWLIALLAPMTPPAHHVLIVKCR